MQRFPLGSLAALLLSGMVAGHAQAQCGTGGSCLEVSQGPACEDLKCCASVCGNDVFCCTTAWDSECVLLANSLCAGLCGAAASGPCFAGNATPSCDNEACCLTVCESDAFCCETQWDQTCAFLAGFLCEAGKPGICGDPAAGPCDTPSSNGACSDGPCCNAVCGLDPSCCEAAWDSFCVLLAEEICVADCTLPCPPEGLAELEACGENSNDPCDPAGGVAEAIACGDTRCGTVAVGKGGVADRDAWRFVVEAPAGTERRVRIAFAAEAEAFVAVLPQACSDLSGAIAVLAASLCVTGNTTVCLPSGEHLLVVVPGTPESPGGDALACDRSDYTLGVTCLDLCEDPCGASTGACGSAHGGVGCSDATCCEAVCTRDPLCCEKGWDDLCVTTAIELCDLPPPFNDACSDALEIGIGATLFDTLLATDGEPPYPKACGGGPVSRDVWFAHTVACSGILRVETCGSIGFDTRIALYRDGCEDLLELACNDDSELCTPSGASRLLAEVECGERILIRVGGQNAAGTATLTLSCDEGECSDCLGDLDGDGEVGGADLGTLLNLWGTSDPAGDLDGNGSVNGADLAAMLQSWGPCR